jgi:hypothetical protein
MPPAGPNLLDLCDAVRDAPPIARAISLLAACSGIDEPDAAALDIGTFDARLLDLCQSRFGNTLPARMRCAGCGAEADLELPIAALRQPSGRTDASLQTNGVTFRLPRAADLLALPLDPDAARRALLVRCITSPQAADTPDDILAAIAAAMADAAPQADVIIATPCDACGNTNEAMLDPTAFLWQSLAHGAQQLADEVHALAAAYHWSESDILALTSARRRRYLDRIGA